MKFFCNLVVRQGEVEKQSAVSPESSHPLISSLPVKPPPSKHHQPLHLCQCDAGEQLLRSEAEG